ncbi:hypothetical protein H0E87_005364, partial [Populus deltoides]
LGHCLLHQVNHQLLLRLDLKRFKGPLVMLHHPQACREVTGFQEWLSLLAASGFLK